MKTRFQRLLSGSIAGFLATLAMAPVISLLPAHAAVSSRELTGQAYVFGENSSYDISSATATGTTDTASHLGTLSFSGDIVRSYTDTVNHVKAYEIAADTAIELCFTYDNSLKEAAEEEWHITQDKSETVDGITLGGEINTGAIIYQISYDCKIWATLQIDLNLFNSSAASHTIKYSSDALNNQLMNGCYYRIITAYETEKKVGGYGIGSWQPIDKFEYQKCAEEYIFYASYKDARKNIPDKDELHELGSVVKTGTDNGYVGDSALQNGDPHYGWKIGQFNLSGFTRRNEDDTYLKTLGDQVTLWFELEQNITCLNGQSKWTISEDKNGYDQTFQTSPTNFGHGALIIQYTDYQGKKHDPLIYTDFLRASAFPGANTRVELFEEGNYEVALDYEIYDSDKKKYHNYRIAFSFRIRNGNCMVFPFDTVTKSELTNTAVTENGFYLDLAKSRYLNIDVKMDQWTKGANGYTTDTRFNRPAADGDSYTAHGIYTITVSNPYTNQTTTKQIYVGNDMVMVAYMNPKNSTYSVNEIAQLVDQGAVIEADGTIVLPVDDTETTVSSTTTTATTTTTTTAASSETTVTTQSQNKSNTGTIIWVCVAAVIALLGGGGGYFYLKQHKQSSEQIANEEESV